ncbi:MAG TPA: hypothetical protein VNI77_11560 [Nitrososphaera sp.]|nr:hypothetical protein [Nitrososphaera sp.]
MKGIGNWYFGLHTALKLNNMTHEHFAAEDVISDLLFRAKPLNISGSKFKFTQLSPRPMSFGIKNDSGGMPYSSGKYNSRFYLSVMTRRDEI